jgi:hypothetical protein
MRESAKDAAPPNQPSTYAPTAPPPTVVVEDEPEKPATAATASSSETKAGATHDAMTEGPLPPRPPPPVLLVPRHLPSTPYPYGLHSWIAHQTRRR